MAFLIVLIPAFSLIVEVSAIHNITNCTEEFQTLLETATEVKNHCNIRGFYDCCEAKLAGKLAHLYGSSTGVYSLNNVCSSEEDDEDTDSIQQPMRVMCDMDTDGGGWTVIMRRKRSDSVFTNVNFYRKWDYYENGFGNLNTEFWLGLRNIHCLTTRDDVDLMIDLRENNGNGMTWTYHLFKVSGSNDKYRLEIGKSEGPLGTYDAMAAHNGQNFSTVDSDNDGKLNYNCAQAYNGGWWFHLGCYNYGSFLTGPHSGNTPYKKLLWSLQAGTSYDNFKYYDNVQMKIRPKSCTEVCENI